MPSENRILTFAPAEVIAALMTLAKRTGTINIGGRVHSVKFQEESEITAILGIEGNRSLQIGQGDLEAALIYYCVATKVPLPSAVGKTLRIRGGELELVMSMPDPATERKNRVYRI